MGNDVFGHDFYAVDGDEGDAWLGFKIAMKQNNDGWKFSAIDLDPCGSNKLNAIFKLVVNGVVDFRRVQAHEFGKLEELAGLAYDHLRGGIPVPEIKKALEAIPAGIQAHDAKRYTAYWNNIQDIEELVEKADMRMGRRQDALLQAALNI